MQVVTVDEIQGYVRTDEKGSLLHIWEKEGSVFRIEVEPLKNYRLPGRVSVKVLNKEDKNKSIEIISRWEPGDDTRYAKILEIAIMFGERIR